MRSWKELRRAGGGEFFESPKKVYFEYGDGGCPDTLEPLSVDNSVSHHGL